MRGNKIWNIALTLSIVLSMLAFVVAPVPAAGNAVLSAPTVDNPLYGPGDLFPVDVLVGNVVNMWSFELTLKFAPSHLTATSIAVNPVDPLDGPGFKETTTEIIDNATGIVTVAANRGYCGPIYGEVMGIEPGGIRQWNVKYPRIGDRDGDGDVDRYDITLYYDGVPVAPSAIRSVARANYPAEVRVYVAPPVGTVISIDYVHPALTTDQNFPIATIVFHVESVGISDLILQDVTLLDINKDPIPVDLVPGSFINIPHGYIAAPLFKNEALVAGNEFDIVITADHVREPTWGVSFFIDYDTNVLTALNGTVDDAAGNTFVEVIGLELTTVDPVPLTAVHFKVDAEGWSVLNIRDVLAVSIYGDPLVFEHTDGSFASNNVIDLSGRGAWPDTHQAKYGDIDILHARVATNATGAPVTFEVVFTIYDSEGGYLVGEIKTEPMTIPELTTVEVTAPFDTTAYGKSPYRVWIGAQIAYDSNGDGIMDFLGDRVKPIPIKVKA